ncbi:MAG: RluA family pseudouridine synthase [Muribaculaceae bacterium]|nr:RluA family pseudouridine synthase [Muribaculaceae bacterium]MBP3639182.1 RluA family pseudouridine synthase [Muribaculaceae bacterium]
MRQLSCKPGAERSRLRPDVILEFTPEADARLLDFLYQAMPDRKRTTVKDYLRHRQVMVDGNVTSQWDTPVGPASLIRVNTSREFQTLANPRLRIVYEDDDIIVVNKGYGLLSVGTDTKREGTAYSILRDYVKRVNPRNKLFIVHRLDQHTSGLMLFAKTEQAKETMQHNWNNMVLERRYVAVVEGGAPEPPEGQVRTLLAENSEHVVYVTDNPAEGREALTEYCTLAARGNYALLELELATGRKNQIRVHMQHIGHPIAGDRKYGAKTSPIHRLALHARTLRFVHPVTRRDMNFSTPVPAAFRKML